MLSIKRLNFVLAACLPFLLQSKEVVIPFAEKPMKIAVIGAGHVGMVTGACLSQAGHHVTFIENDQERLNLLNCKHSPINEPYLETIVASACSSGMIKVIDTIDSRILEVDLTIICVETPALSQDTPQQLIPLQKVLGQLTEQMARIDFPPPVVISSSLLPTSFRQLQDQFSQLRLVVHPEFLRESTAVLDFLNPPFSVVGGDNPRDVELVLSLYRPFGAPCFALSAEAACMLKYMCNAWHATKVAFVNEIATICDANQIDPMEVARIFTLDRELNCSAAYLKPGFAFGGPCLEKDVQALSWSGQDLNLPLIDSILPSNSLRFERILQKILNNQHKKLAVIGMSFKKKSDDLRCSPFLQLIARLYQEGIELAIYDPDVQIDRLSHSSKKIMDEQYAYLWPLIHSNLALEDVDGVVLCKNLVGIDVVREIKKKNLAIYDLGYFLSGKTME